MDTDIDNYSYNELLHLLKLKDGKNINLIVNNTHKTLNKIENSTLENKEQLIDLFKKCCIQIMIINKHEITRDIIENLKLTIDQENDVYDKNNINDFNYNDKNDKNITFKNPTTTLPKPYPELFALNTIQSDYGHGIVNPIKRDTIKHLLVLNSKYENVEKTQICNKITGCNNTIKLADFTTQLQEHYKNVISIRVDSIQFNNTYYPFSYYLDTVSFTIKTFEYETGSSDPESTKENIINNEIIISEGVYTINTLLNAVNIAIQDLSANPILGSIQFSYNSVLGKYLFILNDDIIPPPGISYGFDLDFLTSLSRTSYLNMGWLMGFQKDNYNFFEDYVFSKVTQCAVIGIIADSPAKLIGSNFFLIEVDDYNKNNPVLINYNINSPYSFNIKNLLGIIPNNIQTNYNFQITANQTQEQTLEEPESSQIQTQNISSNVSDFNDLCKQLYMCSKTEVFKPRRYFGPVRIKKLRIRLLDENGRVVNLNNCNFTIILEIETLSSGI